LRCQSLCPICAHIRNYNNNFFFRSYFNFHGTRDDGNFLFSLFFSFCRKSIFLSAQRYSLGVFFCCSFQHKSVVFMLVHVCWLIFAFSFSFIHILIFSSYSVGRDSIWVEEKMCRWYVMFTFIIFYNVFFLSAFNSSILFCWSSVLV
jgi:hypothetical protein